MVEIKIDVPENVGRKIGSEVDLSLLVRRLIQQLEEEKEMIDWSVKLQRASRKGRFDKLKERGLI